MAEENANLEIQDEEIETLKTVYDDVFAVYCPEKRAFHLEIKQDGTDVTILVKYTLYYPSSGPPSYEISAPSLSKTDKRQLATILEECSEKHKGLPLMCVWIELVKEFLEKLQAGCRSQMSLKSNEIIAKEVVEVKKHDIFHGDIIVDRKNTFQAHVCSVSRMKDIIEVLDQLLSNKKISNATHNIYAYRYISNNGDIVEDGEDDGEHEAGGKLLHLLRARKASGIFVMVSRWYGGNIYSDRFKHICAAANRALEDGNFLNKIP